MLAEVLMPVVAVLSGDTLTLTCTKVHCRALVLYSLPSVLGDQLGNSDESRLQHEQEET
jgi:hypothetical protein